MKVLIACEFSQVVSKAFIGESDILKTGMAFLEKGLLRCL